MVYSRPDVFPHRAPAADTRRRCTPATFSVRPRWSSLWPRTGRTSRNPSSAPSSAPSLRVLGDRRHWTSVRRNGTTTAYRPNGSFLCQTTRIILCIIICSFAFLLFFWRYTESRYECSTHAVVMPATKLSLNFGSGLCYAEDSYHNHSITLVTTR